MFLGPCLGKRKFYETNNSNFACDKGDRFTTYQTLVNFLSYQKTILLGIPKSGLESYKMHVNVNRGACLLRLQRNLLRTLL